MQGLCDLCGKFGILNTCSLCGRRACLSCYILPRDVCRVCTGGFRYMKK